MLMMLLPVQPGCVSPFGHEAKLEKPFNTQRMSSTVTSKAASQLALPKMVGWCRQVPASQMSQVHELLSLWHWAFVVQPGPASVRPAAAEITPSTNAARTNPCPQRFIAASPN